MPGTQIAHMWASKMAQCRTGGESRSGGGSRTGSSADAKGDRGILSSPLNEGGAVFEREKRVLARHHLDERMRRGEAACRVGIGRRTLYNRIVDGLVGGSAGRPEGPIRSPAASRVEAGSVQGDHPGVTGPVRRAERGTSVRGGAGGGLLRPVEKAAHRRPAGRPEDAGRAGEPRRGAGRGGRRRVHGGRSDRAAARGPGRAAQQPAGWRRRWAPAICLG